jgi:hypothetical protein
MNCNIGTIVVIGLLTLTLVGVELQLRSEIRKRLIAEFERDRAVMQLEWLNEEFDGIDNERETK